MFNLVFLMLILKCQQLLFVGADFGDYDDDFQESKYVFCLIIQNVWLIFVLASF